MYFFILIAASIQTIESIPFNNYLNYLIQYTLILSSLNLKGKNFVQIKEIKILDSKFPFHNDFGYFLVTRIFGLWRFKLN